MPALIILLSANLSSAHCNLPLPALDSHVTSKMGKRPDFFGDPSKLKDHWGVDIMAPKGTPVRAVLSGYVFAAKHFQLTGQRRKILHRVCSSRQDSCQGRHPSQERPDHWLSR